MAAPVGDEQLRHLVVVQILPDRGVRRRAEAIEHERDLLLLDQPTDLLDGLGRAIGVVEADEVDLAAVHAALLVDHLEVGGLRAPDHAVGRRRPAVGHGLPDLDLGVGDAGRIVGARRTRACGEGRCGGARLQECTSSDHVDSPFPPQFAAMIASPPSFSTFVRRDEASLRAAARAAPAAPVGIAAITKIKSAP